MRAARQRLGVRSQGRGGTHSHSNLPTGLADGLGVGRLPYQAASPGFAPPRSRASLGSPAPPCGGGLGRNSLGPVLGGVNIRYGCRAMLVPPCRPCSSPPPPPVPALDAAAAARFASLALDCVGREYPNKIAHVLNGDEDARPPHVLTPAFYGCYDWHSAVHGHWLLARLARTFPDAPVRGGRRGRRWRAASPPRTSRARWPTSRARAARRSSGPTAWPGSSSSRRSCAIGTTPTRARGRPPWRRWRSEAARRFEEWLPKLTRPDPHRRARPDRVRVRPRPRLGRGVRRASTRDVVRPRAPRFYLADRSCPMSYEPSGQDFLSPCLAEADLVRRLLPPAEYAAWLSAFLPTLTPRDGARPGSRRPSSRIRATPSSRISTASTSAAPGCSRESPPASPPSDPRLAAVRALARAHREAGLRSVTGAHYEGGHWLGTFAVYLATQRGLRPLDRASSRP